MKMTIDEYDFRNAFVSMNRDNHFSYTGLSALFEYLKSLEEGTGEEMNLDVIGLCCDYTEYSSVEEAAQDWQIQDILEDLREEHGDDDSAIRANFIEALLDYTTVIDVDGEAFIIQSY